VSIFNRKSAIAGIFIGLFLSLSPAQTLPSLLTIQSNGKLGYVADSLGNRIPDYSHAGYKNSEAFIPFVKTVETLSASAGDNLAAIQAAIDRLEALPADANGMRGGLLLKAGAYKISGPVRIERGGIVIRGEGPDSTTGTKLIATQRQQHTLINFAGSAGISKNSATKKKITNAFVSIGATAVTVESGHTFAAGDQVVVEHAPRDAWTAMLGMNNFAGNDTDCNNWTASEYLMNYYRIVKKVDGNSITIDAPVVDPIDSRYADGYLYKCTFGGIEQVGIENLCLVSEYTDANDEQHGWNAVSFSNCRNGWARRIEAWHFGYSAITVSSNASFITVDSCKCLDPVSQTTGGRKYSFNLCGQRCLFMHCHTRGGRHDYVNGARVPGPNVFLRSTATDQKADIGPHHRWSTGVLFDNITGNGALNVQNRLCSGSGHGWAGAQTMFWNCTAKSIIVQNPPQHYNWAMGCKATVTGVGDWFKTPGFAGVVELTGTTAEPLSLFEKQLSDRLGSGAGKLPGPSTIVPASNSFFIRMDYGAALIRLPVQGTCSLRLYAMDGKCVATKTIRSSTAHGFANANLGVLSPGVYNATLSIDDYHQTAKVLVTR
jgi:hypothetical protein